MSGNSAIDVEGIGSMKRSLVEESSDVFEIGRALGNVRGIDAGRDACVWEQLQASVHAAAAQTRDHDSPDTQLCSPIGPKEP